MFGLLTFLATSSLFICRIDHPVQQLYFPLPQQFRAVLMVAGQKSKNPTVVMTMTAQPAHLFQIIAIWVACHGMGTLHKKPNCTPDPDTGLP